MRKEPIHINRKNIRKAYKYLKGKIYKFYETNDNLTFLIFIFALLAFSGYMNFSELTMKKFITIWMVLILSWLAFYNHKNVEKFLLSNFTKVLFSISILLFFLQKYIGVNNTDLILMWGAIFAFWYGYKKYERDKEINMFDKYLLGDLTIENIENDMKKWLVAYELYSSGYITERLFNLIDINNNEVLINFINKNLLIIDMEDKEKQIEKISEGVSQFTPYPEFYKYIKITLEKYQALLPKLIALEKEDSKEKDKLKNILTNLDVLLKSMKYGDDLLKNLNN